MTLSPEDQAWRDNYGKSKRSKPTRGDGRRFKPKRAIVSGGWLGQLAPAQIKVLWVLDDFADSKCCVRISHATIGKYAGMRREHAARATASLETLGLVRVVERGRTFGKSGKRTANVYELLAPEPFGISAAGGTNNGDAD